MLDVEGRTSLCPRLVSAESSSYSIYTDGGLAPLDAITWGGSAAVIYYNGSPVEALVSCAKNSTNNQAEITGFLHACELVPHVGGVQQWHPVIRSDSMYVISGVKKYAKIWQKNEWVLSDGQPVKNKIHWQSVLACTQGLAFDLHHVKGHSGDPGNYVADLLAGAAARAGRGLDLLGMRVHVHGMAIQEILGEKFHTVRKKHATALISGLFGKPIYNPDH